MKTIKSSPKNGRTQKAMCINIDIDLLPALAEQPNKARFINEAIREKIAATL